MLLSTIKSRNIYLWSETVMPATEEDTARTYQQTLENLTIKINDNNENLTILNDLKNAGTISDEDYTAKSTPIMQENAALTAQYNALVANDAAALSNLNTISYNTYYSVPFSLTGLQTVQTTWEHTVGEVQGLTSNFLQAWHHKPVTVAIKGASYFGAYDGTVLDIETIRNTLNNDANEATAQSILTQANNAVSSALSTAADWVNTLGETLNSTATVDTLKPSDNVIDKDIFNLKTLVSAYGEGPLSSNLTKGATRVHMLIENEPGAADTTNCYVTFTGFIKRFDYTESIDNPFVYMYTVEFVGTPSDVTSVDNAKLQAKKDSDAMTVSLTTSSAGISLGYGF